MLYYTGYSRNTVIFCISRCSMALAPIAARKNVVIGGETFADALLSATYSSIRALHVFLGPLGRLVSDLSRVLDTFHGCSQ